MNENFQSELILQLNQMNVQLSKLNENIECICGHLDNVAEQVQDVGVEFCKYRQELLMGKYSIST